MLRFEISYQGIVAIILALVVVWAFIELWPVILLVLVALILMIGLLPYVDAMVRWGMPRPPAVLVLLTAILAVTVGLVSIMVPPLVDEISAVKENLPESAREVEKLLANFGIDVELEERARNIDWDELLSGREAITAGQQVLTTTLSVLTIIVITAYLLADTPRLGNFVRQFIPSERRVEGDWLFQQTSRVVGGYLRGQLITSLSIGVFTFVLLQIVGVENSLAFAVLAGFADVVPLVGAFIAIIPPVAAALQQSGTQAVIVLACLLAYQQFEDRFLVPRVYGRTLNLPPLIVLIAVLAGAELLGITGVLLALPLTAAGRVALDYAIENRRLPLMPATDQVLAPDRPVEEAAPPPGATGVTPEAPGGTSGVAATGPALGETPRPAA